jgi:hypothetical protein
MEMRYNITGVMHIYMMKWEWLVWYRNTRLHPVLFTELIVRHPVSYLFRKYAVSLTI